VGRFVRLAIEEPLQIAGHVLQDVHVTPGRGGHSQRGHEFACVQRLELVSLHSASIGDKGSESLIGRG
jgi:hypothetical protein